MGVVKREEPFFCLFGLKELYYHAENNGMQRLFHNAVLLIREFFLQDQINFLSMISEDIITEG